jgi:uncharacterized protein DUF1353
MSDTILFPDAPDTDPYKDDDQLNDTEYRLRSSYQYTTLANVVILVPEGFRTDEVSAPQATWSFVGMPPDGYYRAAGVVHDYIYSLNGKLPTITYTRQQCDQILVEILSRLGMSWLKKKLVYLAVRIGGASHWKGN